MHEKNAPNWSVDILQYWPEICSQWVPIKPMLHKYWLYIRNISNEVPILVLLALHWPNILNEMPNIGDFTLAKHFWTIVAGDFQILYFGIFHVNECDIGPILGEDITNISFLLGTCGLIWHLDG